MIHIEICNHYYMKYKWNAGHEMYSWWMSKISSLTHLFSIHYSVSPHRSKNDIIIQQCIYHGYMYYMTICLSRSMDVRFFDNEKKFIIFFLFPIFRLNIFMEINNNLFGNSIQISDLNMDTESKNPSNQYLFCLWNNSTLSTIN